MIILKTCWLFSKRVGSLACDYSFGYGEINRWGFGILFDSEKLHRSHVINYLIGLVYN